MAGEPSPGAPESLIPSDPVSLHTESPPLEKFLPTPLLMDVMYEYVHEYVCQQNVYSFKLRVKSVTNLCTYCTITSKYSRITARNPNALGVAFEKVCFNTSRLSRNNILKNYQFSVDSKGNYVKIHRLHQ